VIEDDAIRIARVREAARAEIDGFLATYDACSFAPPICAALLRAWHALASLEALLLGTTAQSAPEFVASLGRGDRAARPPVLRDIPDDFVAGVVACALSDPWVVAYPPSDQDFDQHRRALLRAFAGLNRRVLRSFPALGVPWTRLLRAGAVLIAVVALAAVSLRLTVLRPRWIASYYANDSLSGAPAHVSRQAEADENWGQGGPGAGLPTDNFSARFETCLVLDKPANVAMVVGSDDGSRLFVDDRKVIDAWVDQPYATHQQSVALDKGAHRLRLEYYERQGNARLTFSARAENSDEDLSRMLRLPAAGASGCAR
jgi:PA14 domain-containing protein